MMVLFYLRFSFSLAYGGINIPLKKNCGFLQGSKEGRVKKIENIMVILKTNP